MPRKDAPSSQTENSIFAQRLRQTMEQMKMTQVDLAKEIGVQRQTVSLYTLGQSSPDAERLILIANALKTTPNYLLGFTEDPDIQPCATDELGLSPLVVRGIKALPTSTRIYVGKFLERHWPRLLWLFFEVNNLKSAVSRYLEEYKDCDFVEEQKEADQCQDAVENTLGKSCCELGCVVLTKAAGYEYRFDQIEKLLREFLRDYCNIAALDERNNVKFQKLESALGMQKEG